MHRSTSDSQCKRARNDQSINLSVIYLQTQRPCISDGRRRDLHLGIWHSTRPVYRILSVSARPAGQMCLGTGDDDGRTDGVNGRGSVGNVLLGVRPPARSATPHPSIHLLRQHRLLCEHPSVRVRQPASLMRQVSIRGRNGRGGGKARRRRSRSIMMGREKRRKRSLMIFPSSSCVSQPGRSSSAELNEVAGKEAV